MNNYSQTTQNRLISFVKEFENVIFVGDDPILKSLLITAKQISHEVDREEIAYHMERIKELNGK